MSAQPAETWADTETVEAVLADEVTGEAHAPPRALLRLLDAVDWLIFRSEIHVSEVACAFGAVVWATTIAVKPNLFATNPNYTQLATRTHELNVMWMAILFLVVSITALAAYSLDYPERIVFRFRRSAMLAYAFFYSAGVASFAAATGVGVTAGLHLIFAVLAAWGYWRLGRQAREISRPSED